MMASIQTLLRSLLQSNAKSLAEILADLNQTLYGSSTAERYSTLFCGTVSADRRSITYVNAGHVPPLLLHRDGTLERLGGGGLPVGILPGATYEQFTVDLIPGDTLVVVSDGIVEVRNSSEDFWDEEEVEKVLLDQVGIDISRIPALLCDAADRFAKDAEQYDDMTVVAIRVA